MWRLGLIGLVRYSDHPFSRGKGPGTMAQVYDPNTSEVGKEEHQEFSVVLGPQQ